MILRETNEIEDKKELMSPTPEWMAEKYDEMNRTLFNGALGGCSFGIFTTGKGSGGRTLGWFQMDNVKYEKGTRRMFKYDKFDWFSKIYVNKDNFVDICHPRIELNGNYRWTEKAAITTLVHEMCHYYTYMNGLVPMQAHGWEFKNIGHRVSAKSNGIFTIERLAKAEQMEEMELIGAAKEKASRKVGRATIILVYKDNGQVRLIICGNQDLVNNIISFETNKKDTLRIQVSDDEKLKAFLVSKGFCSVMRSYRFWHLENKSWVKDLDNFDLTTVYSKKESYNMRNAADKTEEPKKAEPMVKRIPSFKIRVGGPDGEMFELKNVTEDELRQQLRARFPKWSDTAIENIASNPKYRLNEDRIRDIVEEVMNRTLRGMDDDVAEITPDMNLGIIDLK